MPLEATTGGDITAESHPLLFAIAQDYKERFGSTAGLKKALRDDPFSVLVEVLPIISKLGKAGKLGKFAQTTPEMDTICQS